MCSGEITQCHGYFPVVRRPPPAAVHFDGHGGVLVQPVSPELVALNKVVVVVVVVAAVVVVVF